LRRRVPPKLSDAPILFRGRSYSSPKRFRGGTHRSRTPEESLAVASTYFGAAGITRLADVTGLDRIGIPTILAFRPNGRTLSVSAGKGLDVTAATISAAMEAIEIHQAEHFLLPDIRASWRDMAKSGAIIPADLLPLARNSLFSLDWPYRWSLGWDIVGQREVATPRHMVNMEGAGRRADELGAFQVTSNGLASGNDFLEALTAGLLEVVERDAVTCSYLPWERGLAAPPRIRTDSIADPLLRALLDRIAAARAEILLFDCRIDTGIPVFLAVLRDLDDPRIGLYRGAGAHLDPVVAAARAITEAVQSRAVYIAGSRDDLFKQGHARLRQTDPLALTASLTRDSALIDWPAGEGEATDSFEGDVRVILGKLDGVGLSSVIVHDLTGPICPVSVLKVVVPGAEGNHTDWYAPGPRARARMARSAA
jgi:ribosomal protein S12 methylthiotransferase accessory factor